MMRMIPTVKKTLTSNIKEELKRYILSLDTSTSAKLPAETYIAEKFHVSRGSIRRALDELEQENILIRIHGKGTFVNPEALQIKVSLTPAHEFSKLISDSGYKPRVELTRLNLNYKSPEVEKILSLGAGTRLVLAERAYYADEHLAIICLNYIPAAFFDPVPLPDEWNQYSSFQLLRERCGKLLVRDRIEIQTKSIPQLTPVTALAKELNCESVLELDTVNYDLDNVPVMYGLIFYNTNYIRYNLIRAMDVY